MLKVATATSDSRLSTTHALYSQADYVKRFVLSIYTSRTEYLSITDSDQLFRFLLNRVICGPVLRVGTKSGKTTAGICILQATDPSKPRC